MITSSPGTSRSSRLKSAWLAHPVAGEHDVADLTGHRRAGPVSRPVVERGQPDALEDGAGEPDRRDLQQADLDARLGAPVLRRWGDGDGQRGRVVVVGATVVVVAVVVDVDVDVDVLGAVAGTTLGSTTVPGVVGSAASSPLAAQPATSRHTTVTAQPNRRMVKVCQRRRSGSPAAPPSGRGSSQTMIWARIVSEFETNRAQNRHARSSAATWPAVARAWAMHAGTPMPP